MKRSRNGLLQLIILMLFTLFFSVHFSSAQGSFPSAELNPSWSPDGSEIAFFSLQGSQYELFVADAFGMQNVRPLGVFGNPFYGAQWSPDGSEILYVDLGPLDEETASGQPAGNHDVFIVAADGSGSRSLTLNEYNDTYPAWSPDGSMVAFVSDRDVVDMNGQTNRQSDIYLINADGTDEQLYTKDTWSDTTPKWSPDGTQLAFVSDRDFTSFTIADLYIETIADNLGVENTPDRFATRVTNSLIVQDFVWSPTDPLLALSVQAQNGREIFIVDTSGSLSPRLDSRNTGTLPMFSWTPDGTQLTFDVGCGFTMVDSAGSNPVRVSNGCPFYVTWSPDGSQIAFVSNQSGGDPDIYVGAPDATGSFQVHPD